MDGSAEHPGRVPSASSVARRREERRAALGVTFGNTTEAALDVLALMDLAWHDCYGESTPPAGVIDDVVLVGGDEVAALARAAFLGVQDARDLRLQADYRRAGDSA